MPPQKKPSATAVTVDKDWESVDLNWIIAQSLHAAAERLATGDIQVDLDLNLQVPKFLAVPDSLSQIFDSLLTYSSSAFDRLDDERERKIHITTRLHDETELEVIYGDNAGGISEDVRRNMAQPLLPIELEKGCGGVWIKKVVSLVSDHQGSVGVETDTGEGSTFILRFPLSAPLKS